MFEKTLPSCCIYIMAGLLPVRKVIRKGEVFLCGNIKHFHFGVVLIMKDV